MISRLVNKSTELVRSLYNDFREFVSPSLCLGCGGEMDAENRFLCGVCDDSLSMKNNGEGPICPFCGRPHGVSGSCRFCAGPDCLRLYFWGVYDGLLKDCIAQFKFKGIIELGRELAARSLASLSSRLDAGAYDLVIPVPLYRSRKREREFNQSEVIAVEAASFLHLGVDSGSLVRSRKTEQQAKLEEERRWVNVKGAFALDKNADLTGKRILLVDDIVTTGATVFEASRPLRQAGSQQIDVFSLAYAV
jgi:ComF family protein